MGVRQDFDRIKRLFFPRWDRAGLWRVTTNSRRRLHGFCDQAQKRIEIVTSHDDADKHDALIIHETCHAVTGGGHGNDWQARMEKAAVRATELKRRKVARILRDEIAAYRAAPQSVEYVYQGIEDAVFINPRLTLMQIKRRIAYDHGLLASEVCRKFPRTEKVYLTTKREAEEYEAAQRKFQKRCVEQ